VLKLCQAMEQKQWSLYAELTIATAYFAKFEIRVSLAILELLTFNRHSSRDASHALFEKKFQAS